NGGRNHHGVITVQHRGGGAKRRYRVIDFKRDKFDVWGVVEGGEYDPNRSANIALIRYEDGELRYILAPIALTVGQRIVSSTTPVAPRPGVAMRLRNIPPGLNIHNIELVAGRGGEMCRSAGTYA